MFKKQTQNTNMQTERLQNASIKIKITIGGIPNASIIISLNSSSYFRKLAESIKIHSYVDIQGNEIYQVMLTEFQLSLSTVSPYKIARNSIIEVF